MNQPIDQICKWCGQPIIDNTIIGGMHQDCYNLHFGINENFINSMHSRCYDEACTAQALDGHVKSITDETSAEETPIKEAIFACLGKYHLCVGAPEQLAELWRDKFVVKNGDMFAHSGQPMGHWIALQLKKQEYQHFIWAGDVKIHPQNEHFNEIAAHLERIAKRLRETKHGEWIHSCESLEKYAKELKEAVVFINTIGRHEETGYSGVFIGTQFLDHLILLLKNLAAGRQLDGIQRYISYLESLERKEETVRLS